MALRVIRASMVLWPDRQPQLLERGRAGVESGGATSVSPFLALHQGPLHRAREPRAILDAGRLWRYSRTFQRGLGTQDGGVSRAIRTPYNERPGTYTRSAWRVSLVTTSQ